MKKKISISLLIFITIIFYSNAQTGIWEELHPKNSPLPRLGFGMAEIGDGKVLIFGGDSENGGLLDETWLFDINENTWTKINNDIHPSKRYDHGMSRITKNKVLLFGGWYPLSFTNPEYYDDTWIFDLDSLSWSEFKPNLKPSPRRSFGFAQIFDGKVLLFGGDTVVANYDNDTWIFDFQGKIWTKINLDTVPPKCERAMMAQIDSGKVLFYGGWGIKKLDQTWLFDYNYHNWIKINPKINSIPIFGSSMTNINKSEIVFWGGNHGPIGNYNEMWLFNLNDSTWVNVQTNIKPDGRFLHQIVKIDNNKIILFGGHNNKTSLDYNDTWIFTLQTNDNKENEYPTSINNCRSYLITDNESKLKIKYCNVGTFDYQIYDIFGNKLFEKEDVFVNSDQAIINIDVSGFPNGLYFLITHQNNNVEVSKVLINR